MEADSVGEDGHCGACEKTDGGREKAEQRGLVRADAFGSNVDSYCWQQSAQTCADDDVKNSIMNIVNATTFI